MPMQIGAEWLSVRAGGLNRYTEGLARSLVAAGHPHRWLVMGDDRIDRDAGVDVRPVAAPTDSLLRRWRGVRSALHATSPPLVATHFALYGYAVRKQLRKLPHVVHFHGPWADESVAERAGKLAVLAKRHVERSVYATGDRFVTLSQAFADLLAERYRVDPALINVVPGGVDTSRFGIECSAGEARARLGWPTDRPTTLCVRRLVRRMGLEQLVEAMRAVRDAVPDAVLLIAGKGPLSEELDEQVRHLGLEDTVKLLGFVPDDDLPLAYRAADVSIVPTQTLEGFGLIIAESLAAGTPAIVTPVGGMPEVVSDLDPTLVLEDSSTGSIEAALVRALQSPKTLPTPTECRDHARARFDWSVVVQRLLAIYDEAIEQHG
ncbi:MAG: glycosyltransferase family 4 protein [Planctomycetota bacterium]